MTKCKHCGGSGLEPDQKKIAEAMAKRRKWLGFTLSEMSSKLGISISFLHDLEKGRRPWSPERVEMVEAMEPKDFVP